MIYGTMPYKENAKLNSIISVLPADVQKQAEKLLLVFADTVRITTQSQASKQNSDEK